MSICERNGILKHLWGGIVAVLLAIAVQTGGAVFWAGAMTARMQLAEQRIDRLETRLYGSASGPSPLAASHNPAATNN